MGLSKALKALPARWCGGPLKFLELGLRGFCRVFWMTVE